MQITKQNNNFPPQYTWLNKSVQGGGGGGGGGGNMDSVVLCGFVKFMYFSCVCDLKTFRFA